MGKKLALGLAAVVILLTALIALQPSTFVVERSLVIGAPAAVVYPHIASLRAMDAWSPWARMDASLKTVYAGPEAGVGSRSAWEGPEMGKGRIAITAVKPDQEVEMQLEMLTPLPATNRILFRLDPQAGGTGVTWRMEGRNAFVGKALSLVMDMDTMVGGEFEKGLAALKTLAETEAARPQGG
jgi:hypothetical protein